MVAICGGVLPVALGVSLVPELALPKVGVARVGVAPLEPTVRRRLALAVRSLRSASPATKALLLARAQRAAPTPSSPAAQRERHRAVAGRPVFGRIRDTTAECR